MRQNDRYGCHCQMKDLISQDYIDYQYEGGERKQHPYSGIPVDDLDRACHNHRLVNTEKTWIFVKVGQYGRSTGTGSLMAHRLLAWNFRLFACNIDFEFQHRLEFCEHARKFVPKPSHSSSQTSSNTDLDIDLDIQYVTYSFFWV